ncbi:hypothetical protein PR048_012792 [Dryococelus australis]|uniref:Uncharacterized protein n=1 Tax=Dryococelus australis TaxID=614101 RepID=A0ABQ9HQM0_9NEOP|nr:hypothetical protein PR048_012792 [Dryococelus australis]
MWESKMVASSRRHTMAASSRRQTIWLPLADATSYIVNIERMNQQGQLTLLVYTLKQLYDGAFTTLCLFTFQMSMASRKAKATEEQQVKPKRAEWMEEPLLVFYIPRRTYYCAMSNITHPYDISKGVADRKWLRVFLKRHHGIANRKTQIVTFANAIGTAIPSMILLKGQRLKPKCYNDMPVGSLICMCSKGSSTNALFIRWLEHFSRYKACLKSPRRKHPACSRPVRDNTLLPMELLLGYDRTKDIRLTRSTLGPTLSRVWGRSVTAPNIVSGFRVTGIYPFEPHKIPDEAFAPSAVTEIPQEEVANDENVNDSSHSNDPTRKGNVALINDQNDTDDSSNEQFNMSFNVLNFCQHRNLIPEQEKKLINYQGHKGKTNVKGTRERKDAAPRTRKMARLESNHNVQKDRESLGEFGNPSTSVMNVSNDSWYCSVCETDEEADMMLYSTCLKHFHENRVGITKRDKIDDKQDSCQTADDCGGEKKEGCDPGVKGGREKKGREKEERGRERKKLWNVKYWEDSEETLDDGKRRNPEWTPTERNY